MNIKKKSLRKIKVLKNELWAVITGWGGDDEEHKFCPHVGHRPIGLGGLKASLTVPAIEAGAVDEVNTWPSRL